MSKYLPQALGATGVVVAGPVVAVWALRAWQVVGSTAVAVGIGVFLSLAVSFAGSAYWANRDSSRDVLFSELMIWGWLRRWRAEHKLTAALERLAEQTAAGVGRAGTPQLAMLTELAEALEAGDPYTRNHSRRVARYASMIAERLGLAADEVDRIRTAAMVHDVGKVRTPIEVLHKPGRLTDEEYTIIKAHPVDGAHLVEALGDDRLTAIVRHHHERLDGRGYPDGLKGEDIPLGARIVSVADTFDAITSARAYRAASPHRKALDILIKEAGTQLDADAVRAFRACYTGRRPFALWMTVLAFPQRLSTTLGNGTTATAASLPKVVMAASTVALVGGAAASARPLMVVPAGPQATATTTVAAAAAEVAQSGTTPVPSAAAPSVPPAVGAKLTSPSVRTREQKMLRAPRNLSRRFPMSGAAAHHVARSSSPVSTTPPSPPAGAPTPRTVPGSSSTGPVSTVAAAPTETTPTAANPPTGSGSGSARSSAKDHGHGLGGSGRGNGNGNGNGSGSDNGKGHRTDTGKTKTTTTTSGSGTGNSNGTGSDHGRGSGNTNGSGNATTSTGANGNGNAAGTGSSNGNGAGSSSADGNANGASGGAFSMGGNGSGNGAPTGTGDGNGTGAGTTGTTGTGAGNGTSPGTTGAGAGNATGTGTTTTTGNGNGGAAGTSNGAGSGAAGTTGNGTTGTIETGAAGTTGNGNGTIDNGTGSRIRPT